MTDPQLALRAEQALIGALLADPRRIQDPYMYGTPWLKHPTYSAIAQEIKASSSYPGVLDDPARLIERITERLALPGVDADYLHGLARTCPDPADIAIYARMVTEAQIRATLAAQAERIAAIRIEPGEQHRAGNLERLAQALQRRASEPVVAEITNLAPALYINTAAPESVTEVQPLNRTRQEELILADLLQHRGQLAEVEWLSPEVFAPGPRREIYETILVVDSYGEPVSELTVEWELDRRRNETRQQDQPEPDRNDPATSPDYIARLAVTAVDVGVAVEIGSVLLEDTLCVSLAAEAAKTLSPGVEPAPSAPATSTPQTNAAAPTAIQPGPAAESPTTLITPPAPSAAADNQPEIRP